MCARDRKLARRDEPAFQPERIRKDEIARVAVEDVRGHGGISPGRKDSGGGRGMCEYIQARRDVRITTYTVPSMTVGAS